MQYEGKRVLFRSGVAIVVLAGLAVGTAVGQRAVAVGKGSYAEFPPPSAGKGAAEMVERKFPLVDRDDRPIPTNKLWTALLEGKAAGSLWMYPWRVDPRESGLELHLPLKWNPTGNDLIFREDEDDYQVYSRHRGNRFGPDPDDRFSTR